MAFIILTTYLLCIRPPIYTSWYIWSFWSRFIPYFETILHALYSLSCLPALLFDKSDIYFLSIYDPYGNRPQVYSVYSLISIFDWDLIFWSVSSSI